MQTRRTFLETLGIASAVGLTPRTSPAAAVLTQGQAVRRGLVSADDFGFDAGLSYLQTGSLGPTPRAVFGRMTEVAREMERNPAGRGYGDLEVAMDDARAVLAAFLGVTRDELVLTTSTTVAMNWCSKTIISASGSAGNPSVTKGYVG